MSEGDREMTDTPREITGAVGSVDGKGGTGGGVRREVVEASRSATERGREISGTHVELGEAERDRTDAIAPMTCRIGSLSGRGGAVVCRENSATGSAVNRPDEKSSVRGSESEIDGRGVTASEVRCLSAGKTVRRSGTSIRVGGSDSHGARTLFPVSGTMVHAGVIFFLLAETDFT